MSKFQMIKINRNMIQMLEKTYKISIKHRMSNKMKFSKDKQQINFFLLEILN